MKKKTILTGIKPTGRIHIGNYIGAIKPALELANTEGFSPIYFVADYHGLTAIQDPEKFRHLSYEIAATWLALGLDPDKAIFYRQSDVPEIFELSWILSCMTSKGLMNRAHAYKALVDKNEAAGVDKDTGVNAGLFTYPILMASDILMFNSELVPVGQDQVQHVEIARDIAENFNKTFGQTFVLPNYIIDKQTAVIPGLDGRKMSKSYGNTIPLFVSPAELKKLIFKIKTDSTPPNEPKDTSTSILFSIYKNVATNEQIKIMENKFHQGIGWGEAKQELFDVMNAKLTEPREKYLELMADPEKLDQILQEGAKKARDLSRPFINEVRRKIGL